MPLGGVERTDSEVFMLLMKVQKSTDPSYPKSFLGCESSLSDRSPFRGPWL